MRCADLQTPTLLIQLDAVRHNLARMRELLGGDLHRWRPHVKTAKVPEVLALLLAAGIRRFKCATSREAAVLLAMAPAGIDLLVAIAHQGPNLARIVELARAHPHHRVAMLSETPAHSQQLRAAGLGVFVDLDPGYHRSGVPLDDRAAIRAIVAAAGDAWAGLHCYDGHLRDDDGTARQAAAHGVYERFAALARELGGDRELVTSGTPTFPCALAYEPFRAFDHTISPGTVVYWDLHSEQLGIPGFRYAVTVQARVVSHPAPDRVTVDAGSKAIDAAVPGPCAAAPGEWQLAAERPSEEHLPFRVTAGARPPLGTLLRLVPAHVCPTVNLADEAALLEGDAVVAVVPVRARGHETLPRC